MRESPAAKSLRRPKRAGDDLDDPDFIPPNQRPPKRVTWGYVKRLYRAEFPFDEDKSKPSPRGKI